MKTGADWYKREPRAIIDAIRAAKMTPLQAALYNLVLDLIYEGAGETLNDPEYFAVHFSGVTADDAKRTIGELCAMPHKLILRGSNLTQHRAQSEAKTKQSLSETRSKAGAEGGRRSGETRRKQRSSSDGEANDEAKQSREEERREEEIRGSPNGDLFNDDDEPTEGEPTFLDHRIELTDDWRLKAMERGKLTEAEARDAWEEFRTYWLDLKAKRNRKGKKSDWLRTWLNYAAGKICQENVGARRRNDAANARRQDARPSSLVARTMQRYR